MTRYLLCVLALLALPVQGAELAGRVINVISGKQIELLTQQNSRFPIELQGIALISDKASLQRAVQRRLNGLIGGRFVRVSSEGQRHNGSLMGFIDWGGQEINLRLVEDGLVRVVPEQLDPERLRLYQSRETAAKQRQLGLWHQAEQKRSLLPQ